MFIADPPQGFGRPTSISVETKYNYENYTIATSQISNDDITMNNFKKFAHLKTWHGLEVKYTASFWRVEVFVPACYATLTEGLCGNFDGLSSNDYTRVTNGTSISYNSAVNWAQTWQVLDDSDDCDVGPSNFDQCTDQTVISNCNRIKSETDIFKPCHSVLSPLPYYDDCVFDHCIDKSIKCAMYDQYVTSCLAQLPRIDLTDNLCDWAEKTGCAPTCGENMVYEGCADLCRDVELKTCGNKDKDAESFCPIGSKYISMCICKPGFVMEDGRCINKSKCGCKRDNGASVPIGFKEIRGTKKCECSSNGYSCSDVTKTPHFSSSRTNIIDSDKCQWSVDCQYKCINIQGFSECTCPPGYLTNANKCQGE